MDPNNTAWSNNKNRFGYNMLVKMGWNEDKGLGQKEDGIKSHIKVKIRKDNKGIGAERTVDGEREWKKGTEGLNNVLARLSRSVTPPPSTKQLNFVAAKETSISGSLSDSEKDNIGKKRKHSDISEDGDTKKEKSIGESNEPQVKKPRQVIVDGGACRPGRMLNMKNVKAKTRELSKEDMACIFGDFLIKRDSPAGDTKSKEKDEETEKKKKEKEEMEKKKEKENEESEKAMDESFKTTISTVSSKDYFKEKMKQKKLNASK